MQAITITRPGTRDVLAVTEHPDPTPGPGEVRIAVAAAGLTFADVSARHGLYPDAPPTPCTVGYEVSGTVDAVGDGVTTLPVGTRVMALTRFGGHSSSVCVPTSSALAIPDGLSFEDAAAIPVNYLTAHHMLFQVGTVHPGSSVLVHMAAGGVGTSVFQLLSTVPDVVSFGTASAPKHDYLRGLGCTHPIDYRSQDYVDAVRAVLGERGVDLVLDPLGGKDWRRSWDLLAPAGRMVAFGMANAVGGTKRSMFRVISQLIRTPRFTPIGAMNLNKSLQGVNMGHLWDEIGLLRPQLERILELWEEGVVKPHVHAAVPFSNAGEAHRMLEEGENRGKVVLIPDGQS
ncbi:MAG: zinc-binding dehydrogenase [Deltaproteobacteria bacterium]|nr:zinc-binding dehydrogenase [Deltaproteobacteria bacterium]